MKIIGLTGGIGSGKSTVARSLQEHGFPIVDADLIAREIVEPGQPALAELAKEFGEDILNADGSLDRGLLASRAFTTKDTTQRLNDITHPRINQRTQELFDEARENGAEAVIYDMPLLIDKGLHKDMDATIVVHAAEHVRLERLTTKRGLDVDDVRRRINAQIDDETRKQHADILLDNNGTEEDLTQQIAQAVDKIKQLTKQAQPR
ncbi:dephospho-CoA kinase [Corynebacterium pseudodiphtheriticum]|jgi:dephospho-coA kinase|uniref:dephospho-CoA kinase n=1 Tax=Corynebacterium pseudodiphtheriticum TaxID=37637 RepID=UPI000F896001|nr:dephospho-CoA kinase [Corynebacterium pseudodiphtheriticum]MCG7252307.1 dephospho-CoA kinase [Corynebacterium pseudodiphtheriticum]MDC7113565.1 dephospho-CoA kinase [Corynebacterium pseudodiphtheriticum]MDK4242847.1 dephospho-CoA kinase [Corynebacterium pseudodiphtheriticum]MDK4277005.1 dephospho-CoA kinase [Corynebacterium pseudodiphtheriticum]MDK4286884.1 dephospho-CoA kinase [Corynebacterium pseudodiphtheriticum]